MFDALKQGFISSIPTITAGIIIAVFTFLLNHNKNNGNYTYKKISCNVPKTDYKVYYFIKHVRDGKNEFEKTEEGVVKNKNIRMKEVVNNSVIGKVKTIKNVGFQFKCFAVCKNENSEDLIKS